MDQLLRQGAQQFNLSLSEAQLHAFSRYVQELISWNQKINLTRIIEPEEIAIKHFLDSLSVYPLLSHLAPTFSLIDVGSGAGFPGLPLKLALPDIQLTLVEATGKKTRFLQHLIAVLSLSKVLVVTARAEEVGRRTEHREQYQVAVARAVSKLAVLVEYTLPLVKVGGLVIAQKGQEPTAELEASAKALQILGGSIKQVVSAAVPGLEAARHLVVIEKTKSTPKQYPRRPGTPLKEPL